MTLTPEDERKIEEGRRLLEALGSEVAGKSPTEILTFLAGIGLAHLRAVKACRDTDKAIQEMTRRIQAGPRPTPKEAARN